MNAEIHIPSGRILPTVWKLLLLRLRINWNSFRHAKLKRKIGTVVLTVFLAALAVFLMWLSWMLLTFLRSPALKQYAGVDAGALLDAMPALILSGLFLGVLLTSFGVLLQALYLSGDMDFLMATPVPMRAVFITKLLQAILPNFSLIAFMGLPLLIGLGLSSGYNFLYYPLLIIVMIVLSLAAAGLSALLVMLVARVVPPKRAAEVLAFLGALIGFTCGQSGNLYQAFGRHSDISRSQTSQMLGLLTRAQTPWFPLNWAGHGLVAIGEGRWLAGTLLLALTLGLAVLAFGFALVTAERWYYSGWAGMQVVAQKKKVVRTAAAIQKENGLSPWARLLPTPVRAILQKDFLTIRRDLRNMSQLISALVFGLIYSVMMLRGFGGAPAGDSEMPAWFTGSYHLIASLSSVGMSIFAGWMMLSRLAGMGFSMEGRNYWLLKASPVPAGQLLLAKFLMAFLPALAMGLFFVVAIGFLQKLSIDLFLFALVAVVMCLAGMTGVELAFGVLGANFNWEDPRRMNSGGFGCLGQFLTFTYIPVSFGLFVAPLVLVNFLNLPPVLGYVGGLTLGAVFAGTCAILPPLLVRRRVERLGEG
jgi:hypothetical protein